MDAKPMRNRSKPKPIFKGNSIFIDGEVYGDYITHYKGISIEGTVIIDSSVTNPYSLNDFDLSYRLVDISSIRQWSGRLDCLGLPIFIGDQVSVAMFSYKRGKICSNNYIVTLNNRNSIVLQPINDSETSYLILSTVSSDCMSIWLDFVMT